MPLSIEELRARLEGSKVGCSARDAENPSASVQSCRKRTEALYQYLLTLPELKEVVSPPWNRGSLCRLYFAEDFGWDKSYLYFDKSENLRAGISEGDRKICMAAQVIEEYQLRKISFSFPEEAKSIEERLARLEKMLSALCEHFDIKPGA